MEIFDNINRIVKDDLAVSIGKGSRVSIASACFSIYAYQALKKQLAEIAELRFVFTAPAFVTEKGAKEKREFYIPRLNRERSLYGTEFEVKLRNELSQKAVARECAEWIRKKATFKANTSGENMMGFINADDNNYMPVTEFTTVALGCERGNNAYTMTQKIGAPDSKAYLDLFEQLWNDKAKLRDVTDEVLDAITAAYQENPPEFIYFIALYTIFHAFLDDISEDILPNEATGFKQSRIWGMLYDFQRDAALAIISKLEQFNGCILADSVGLGKTFTALAVVKYYENRNKSVLVLCPKKLSDNWNTFKGNYKNNPIAADRLRYDVLYHTDLSRGHGKSNGIDLALLNWGNYDLVVIDESHNFRNGEKITETEDGDGQPLQHENRYARLLKQVIRAGIKTKVLMLSATPVNNRFTDLKHQLALAYEGTPELLNAKLGEGKSVEEIFRRAQAVFNEWSELEPEARTTSALLSKLQIDFFGLLDSVTIARSRRHIERYYDIATVGRFPERLPPVSLHPPLTAGLPNAINYAEIYQQLDGLYLTVYTPSAHLFASRVDCYGDGEGNLTLKGREQGLKRLMTVNLLKRLESSVYSFRLTLRRVKARVDAAIRMIDSHGDGLAVDDVGCDANDFDADDENTGLLSGDWKIPYRLNDLDTVSWRGELVKDSETLALLLSLIADIRPEHDAKLQAVKEVISGKLRAPPNPGNKKLLIFTAFADTADYLYQHLAPFVTETFGLHTAMISGSVDGRSTVPGLRGDFNTVLTCFSPVSKEKKLLLPNVHAEIDILIGTDCISEGQNLQDCDTCVNYDIHWNPVRIIQRFGRIDRIGSRNTAIRLVNFWPDMALDEYINLIGRVESRMKAGILTATGHDNPINPEADHDLAYREKQLERLQTEVVDIEEMQSGISIMDLGLNEFRLDLLDYIKRHGDLDKTPSGLHAVVPAGKDCPPGIVFVLKNISSTVNIDNQNRLHPFYLVYISDEGDVACDHLSPKAMLDNLRFLCKGKREPLKTLCQVFNRETKDGKDMRKCSALLQEAIRSILHVKEESDIDSLFKSGGTTALDTRISGLDDFELICFFVIRQEDA